MEKRIILMSPDYGDSPFWDGEEEGRPVCCGGAKSLFLDHDEINLSSVEGLTTWYNEWYIESLRHPHNWTDEQWKEWWQKGHELAKQVKKLLPEDVILQYFTITDRIWKYSPLESEIGTFDYGKPFDIQL